MMSVCLGVSVHVCVVRLSLYCSFMSGAYEKIEADSVDMLLCILSSAASLVSAYDFERIILAVISSHLDRCSSLYVGPD